MKYFLGLVIILKDGRGPHLFTCPDACIALNREFISRQVALAVEKVRFVFLACRVIAGRYVALLAAIIRMVQTTRYSYLPGHPARLALPARPKLLSENGNRSGKDDFKLFLGGKFFFQNEPVCTSPARL